MHGSWRLRRALPVALLALCALAAIAPVFSHTTGMFKDSADYPHDFDQYGCTSCHADLPNHAFAAHPAGTVNWTITDPKGNPMAGSQYTKATVYTIHIELANEQGANQANHAGFNLQASSGKFEATQKDPNVQVSKDGSQATHKNPKETAWTVTWTAPDSGAVSFRLLVNDANGDGQASGADQVQQFFFGFTDDKGAQLGAAATEAVEYGISLQQYWIGLIGVAGMLVVMVAGFVYLKFVNPHNSDQKDR